MTWFQIVFTISYNYEATLLLIKNKIKQDHLKDLLYWKSSPTMNQYTETTFSFKKKKKVIQSLVSKTIFLQKLSNILAI